MNDAGMPAAADLAVAVGATGVVRVTGADRVDLLHRLSTQDLRPLKNAGHTADTLFTTAQGRAMAWVRICATVDALWLVCASDRAAALAAWIARYTIMEDVLAEDCGPAWQQMQIFGLGAHACLGLAAAPDAGHWVQLPALAPISTDADAKADAAVAHFATPLVPAWGPGLLVVLAPAAATRVVDSLRQRGADFLSAAQLHYRRIQAGIPSAQYELQGEVNPFEMRLAASTVHWHKGCYIGQEVISRLDSYNKVARLLVGFSGAVALPDTGVAPLKITCDGRPLGRVTSWVPAGSGCVGLALVKKAAAEAPMPMAAEIETAAGALPIRLEPRPFWR
jgi:folate-binding protein YgfZ